MNKDIKAFNNKQSPSDKAICDLLAKEIEAGLKGAESKVWHAHPVWFINANPIVGYSKLKDSVRLMFWSGADFDEEKLLTGTGKFKDASIRYTNAHQIDTNDLKRWLSKAKRIQWDYKNIIKRRGKLVRLS